MPRLIFMFFVTWFLTLAQVQAQTPGAAGNGKPVTPLVGGPPEMEQPNPLSVDEKELIITGWYGAGGSYAGSVRLMAESTGDLKVLFLPSDLRRQKDGMTVDRQFVTVDGEIQLSPKTPKDMKIKVTGIEEPGTYQGHVEFRAKGATSGKTLDLKLIAKAPQPLTPLPGTDQLKLHLAEGRLSGCLLPAAETINQRMLQFKNPYQLPVKLVAADFVLNGEQTGYQVNPPMVEMKNIGQEQNGAVINLPLDLKRADIPPDKYTGSILLRFEGAKEALALPVVELTMRYGPLRALSLLLLGIVLGWFLLYMKTEGLALSKFARDLDDLKDRINQSESLDRRILTRMLEKVESQVDHKKLKPEEARAQLAKIEDRRNLLLSAAEIEKALTDPKPPNILETIRALRLAVSQENDEEARRLFTQLETAIPPTQPSALMALAIMQGPEIPAGPLQTPLAVTWKQNMPRFFKDIHSFLIKWVGPPIYYVITLLILVLVGFVTLYLKNMTFGAAPVTDYLSLIVWGLGSDVASRNVQNVLAGANLISK
jgi:hypothetical protein